jgi:hypothetical protein
MSLFGRPSSTRPRAALEGERSGLDLARTRAEEAVQAYRRARLAAGRGASRLSATLAELARRRAALAAELDRVGALACPTLEAAAALALAFHAARETLERVDLLAQGGRVGSQRMKPERVKAAARSPYPRAR